MLTMQVFHNQLFITGEPLSSYLKLLVQLAHTDLAQVMAVKSFLYWELW